MQSYYSLLIGTLGILLFLLPLILFYILRKYQFRFQLYLLFNLVFGIIFLFLLANYTDKDKAYQLNQYVKGRDSINYMELRDYNDVAPENLDKVKSLERSLMGIGWQVKAIMFIPFYIVYILIIYLILYLMRKGILQPKLE